MKIPIGGIIALIVIVIHIITVIVKHAEKRRKEDAARRALEARRMQEQGFRGASVSISTSTPAQQNLPQTSAAAPGQVRGDEIAARRQAQLEQLRQRRDSRRASTLSGSSNVSVRTPGSGSKSVSAQPVTPAASGMGIGMQPQVAARDAQSRRQRELQSRQHAQQMQAGREREIRDRARRQAEQPKPAAVIETVESESVASQRRADKAYAKPADASPIPQVSRTIDPYRAVSGREIAEVLKTQLNHPATIRQMVVLKEILDPPVSIRG